MKILDNSNKKLLAVLPDIIFGKLNKRADKFKFIGGGSYGRVYKVQLSDGETIAVKGYKLQGMQHEEAHQLKFLSEHTSVKMPEVLFTYEDKDNAILAMSFVEGQNALSPLFLLKSKSQKQKFADEVISGMLEWHSVTNDKFGSLSDPVYESWYDYYKTERQEPWLKALKELSDMGKFSKNKMKLLFEIIVNLRGGCLLEVSFIQKLFPVPLAVVHNKPCKGHHIPGSTDHSRVTKAVLGLGLENRGSLKGAQL